MAKKFKKIAVLGCLIAVEEMADFTLWFQQKYDFFGTSSVLTPLIALKNQTNLWKQVYICQCTSQGPKITKFELFEGFLALGMTMINRVNGGEKLTFCHFLLNFYQPPLPYHGFWVKFEAFCMILRKFSFDWYMIHFSGLYLAIITMKWTDANSGPDAVSDFHCSMP